MKKIRCDVCNMKFLPGNDLGKDIPNGFGFQLEDGTIINICSTCLCYRRSAVEKFLDDLGIPRRE